MEKILENPQILGSFHLKYLFGLVAKRLGKPLPGPGQPSLWQEPRRHALSIRDPFFPKSLILKLENARGAVTATQVMDGQHQCNDTVTIITVGEMALCPERTLGDKDYAKCLVCICSPSPPSCLLR